MDSSAEVTSYAVIGQLVLPIITGSVVALIVASMTYLASILWRDSIKPRLDDYRYNLANGTRIDGTWCSLPHFGEGKTTISLTVEQRANEVSGTMTVHLSVDGLVDEVTRPYSVRGHYSDGYLSMTFRSADKRVYALGTGLFKLMGGSRFLAGDISMRDLVNDVVDTTSNVQLVFQD
jgi:hypothetical protein